MWCFAKMPAGSMIARRRRMWRSSTAWRSRYYAGSPAKALSKSSANAPAGICPTSPNSLVSTTLEARFPRMTNLRFVLTGGPGAGKTTVLEALAARGYRYVPESARAIIRQRLAAGLSPRPPLEQFGRDILRMDITRYRDTPITDAPVFFDRSVVDAVSMLAEHGALSRTEAAAHISAYRYNPVVFLLPPWQAIYRQDAERDQTFPEAIQVCESVAQWYMHWQYQTVEVPRAGVEERVEFILNTANLALRGQGNGGGNTHR